MGNHDAGRAMVRTALALDDQSEKTGQTALEILDIACSPYRRCDAEFDDDRVVQTVSSGDCWDAPSSKGWSTTPRRTRTESGGTKTWSRGSASGTSSGRKPNEGKQEETP